MRLKLFIATVGIGASLALASNDQSFAGGADTTLRVDNTNSQVAIGAYTFEGTGIVGEGLVGVQGISQAPYTYNPYRTGVQSFAFGGAPYTTGEEIRSYGGDYGYSYAVNAQSSSGIDGVSYGIASFSSGNGVANEAYGIYAQAYGALYNNVGVYSYGSTYAGYFDGNVIVYGTFSNPSDIKFKKNVQPLVGGLDKVMALKPKTYEMKTEEYKDVANFSKGKKFGLIAQEVEAVLPELVSQNRTAAKPAKDGKPATKGEEFKSVDYLSLIPVMLEAIQEQQAEIASLKKQLESR